MLSNSGVCHSLSCSNSCSSIGELPRSSGGAGIGGSTISGRIHKSDYFGRHPPQLTTLSSLNSSAAKKENTTRYQKSPSSNYQLMYIQASCSAINGQPNQFHQRDRNWLKSSQNVQVVTMPHCTEEILELEIHSNTNQSDSYLYRT